METFDLIAFGEVALDIILAGVDKVPRRWSILGTARAACAVSAGTAGYVAQCFAELGGRVSIVGKIGNDNVGRLVLDGFDHCAVSTKELIIDREAETEISTVILYEDGNKSSVVSNILPLRPDEFSKGGLTNGRAFHFAGYLLYPNLWGKDAVSLFKMAKNEGLLVSADPQMSATGDWSQPFQGILEHLDVLLLDEEEAKKISQRKRVNDAIERLLRNGPRIVAVKSGRKGCTVGYGDRIRTIRAYKVKNVSTIGAGDAFDAAFIYGSLQNWSVEKTACFANVIAAISTTQYGCMTAIPRAKTAETISRAYYHNQPWKC
jgi:sugar/nucleoside kinase (ribokinase family)